MKVQRREGQHGVKWSVKGPMSQSLKHREVSGQDKCRGNIPSRKDKGRARDKAVWGTTHRRDRRQKEDNGTLRLDQVLAGGGYQDRKSSLRVFEGL